MPVGRTPEQAAKDQDDRYRDNLEQRNYQRHERGLPPLSMEQYLARTQGRDISAEREVTRTLAAARHEPELEAG